MHRHHRRISLLALTTLAGWGVACDRKGAAPEPADAASRGPAPVALPTTLFASTAPAKAVTVEEARSSAKVGDTVVVRGRVGGSKSPFVENRAMLTLMGDVLKACSDNKDDLCTTPWDYCCDTPADIAKHSAVVQVVDSSGAAIPVTLKGQKEIKELSRLVVAGKVHQAGDNGFVINATAICCERP